MIGVPVDKPSRWLNVVRTDGDQLIVEDGKGYDVRSITSFVVAYPNGEIVDYAKLFEMPGNGIHFTGEAKVAEKHNISLSELEYGNNLVQVTHGPSKFKTSDKPFYYTTTVKNISDKKVKVERFGGYGHSSGDTYVLHTISKGFFTADEFVNWYNQKGEWLLPGESVNDPQNYGGPKALWVYFCVTEDGGRFAAGSLSP